MQHPVVGDDVDRRRGHLPDRRQAGRHRHREHDRLRPLHAEPVQGRRAGRASRPTTAYAGEQTPQSLRRSSSSTSTTRPRSRGHRHRRGRHRVAHAEPDRPQRPRGERQRPRSSRARARSSATGSGSSPPRWARTTRSARPSRRSSTARPSPRTPTTAPSPRRTPSCPPGFGGQKDSFQEKYGEPNVDAAKQILDDAGVQTPVDITLGYTADALRPERRRRGQRAGRPAGRQRPVRDHHRGRRSGSSTRRSTRRTPTTCSILGWYPDILDADNYLSPFIRDGGFFANNYSNDEVNKLLDQELGETDETARNEIIGQLQDIVAEDVPLIPSWFGKNVAVASSGMRVSRRRSTRRTSSGCGRSARTADAVVAQRRARRASGGPGATAPGPLSVSRADPGRGTRHGAPRQVGSLSRYIAGSACCSIDPDDVAGADAGLLPAAGGARATRSARRSAAGSARRRSTAAARRWVSTGR